jgi:hypothetical protein
VQLGCDVGSAAETSGRVVARHTAVMAHQRPTDMRGTEPARQADDPGLSDSVTGDEVSSGAGPDSRPGVLIAVAFLVLFVILLVGAVITGVVG